MFELVGHATCLLFAIQLKLRRQEEIEGLGDFIGILDWRREVVVGSRISSGGVKNGRCRSNDQRSCTNGVCRVTRINLSIK